MDKATDLTAVHVPNEDFDLYSVSESGWYAIDEQDKMVLGPFVSLGECDRAIHERGVLAARLLDAGPPPALDRP